ncbi:hypothetical protein DsansV1_C01g0001451 [Dioscorea sansibarensis]
MKSLWHLPPKKWLRAQGKRETKLFWLCIVKAVVQQHKKLKNREKKLEYTFQHEFLRKLLTHLTS